jgi:hypothetical protein
MVISWTFAQEPGPSFSLQVIRLAGVETDVNIPVSVLLLRFATSTCLDYPLCAYLFTLFDSFRAFAHHGRRLGRYAVVHQQDLVARGNQDSEP